MGKRVLSLVVCVICCGVAADTDSAEVVKEFTGSRNRTTAAFEVKAPWILEWRVNGEYKRMFAVDVALIDARTGALTGEVFRTKRRGNGVRLFKEGGRYRFRVSSTLAQWILRVEQLSEEEAALYTPKGSD